MTEASLSPAALIQRIEDQRRTITVFVPPENAGAVTELAAHFATRNVTVEERHIRSGREGFVVVKSDDGPQRTVPLAAIRTLLQGGRPTDWRTIPKDADSASAVVGLSELTFRSFDRTQMLYTSREIEERAYRVGRGSLYVGFQRVGAFTAQRDAYEALLTRGVHVQAYMGSEEARDIAGLRHPSLGYHVDEVPDLTDYWFLAFDGDADPLQKCALVAEERDPGRYYGVWTYDPTLVDGLIAYLRAVY